VPAVFGFYWLGQHPDWLAALAAALPALATGVIVFKLLLAGAIVRVLLRRDLVGRRVVALAAAAWAVVAAGFFALVRWWVPPELVSPWGVALGVALSVPLSRIAAAPLALASSRHR
jgi:hypothetical protein